MACGMRCQYRLQGMLLIYSTRCCYGSMSCCRQSYHAACHAVQASTHRQDLLLFKQLQDRSRAEHSELSQTLCKLLINLLPPVVQQPVTHSPCR